MHFAKDLYPNPVHVYSFVGQKLFELFLGDSHDFRDFDLFASEVLCRKSVKGDRFYIQLQAPIEQLFDSFSTSCMSKPRTTSFPRSPSPVSIQDNSDMLRFDARSHLTPSP